MTRRLKVIPALGKNVSNLFQAYCDTIFYIESVNSSTRMGTTGMTTSNTRIIYTEGGQQYIAKNRFKLKQSYIYKEGQTGKVILDDIRKYFKEVKQ